MNALASLIHIFYCYLRKIERGITPQQASGEAAKALKTRFGDVLEK